MYGTGYRKHQAPVPKKKKNKTKPQNPTIQKVNRVTKTIFNVKIILS